MDWAFYVLSVVRHGGCSSKVDIKDLDCRGRKKYIMNFLNKDN